MRKGAPWLKTTLMRCAAAAARKKGQLSPRPVPPPARPPRRQKALGALAASILTSVYHMLISGGLYRDLGPHHFDQRAKAVNTRRLVMRLQNLSYLVQITPFDSMTRLCFSLARLKPPSTALAVTSWNAVLDRLGDVAPPRARRPHRGTSRS
jgi:hypothetical protein